MFTVDTHVLARIKAIKRRVGEALAAAVLSASVAIRPLVSRIADGRRMPNKKTMAAIAELKAGKGESFDSVDALMTDLNTDDSPV